MASRNAQRVASHATSAERAPTHVQSVERAAALLRAVAAATGPAATAAALAEAVGLNRTTTWRILATLEQERLVTPRPRDGLVLPRLRPDRPRRPGRRGALARAARAVLHADRGEQTGETAALAVMRDGALTYVAEADAGAIVSVTWQGRPVSMHATSTGKVLLAFSGPDEARALLGLPRGGRLQRFTSATITSLAALEEELAQSRERGFSVCRGEFEESAWGVSAPVLDVAGRPVAVLSIWGPRERITAKRFGTLGAIAMEGAAEIAGRRTPAPV